MIQKGEVFLFAVQDGQFSVLLLHRRPERGNYWQPVTGSREPSDHSIAETAYREVLEETGIPKDQILSVFPDFYTFHFTYTEKGNVFEYEEHCFGFEIRDPTAVTIDHNPVDEHDSVQWFSFAEAMEILKWDENKRALQTLYGMILT